MLAERVLDLGEMMGALEGLVVLGRLEHVEMGEHHLVLGRERLVPVARRRADALHDRLAPEACGQTDGRAGHRRGGDHATLAAEAERAAVEPPRLPLPDLVLSRVAMVQPP